MQSQRQIMRQTLGLYGLTLVTSQRDATVVY